MTSIGRGAAFALAGGIIYGLAPPFTRFAFNAGVPVIETAFWRVAAMALFLGLVALIWRWRVRVPVGSGWLLGLMMLATGSISIGYLGAVQFMPVALTVIIFFTFPIIILLLSPVVEGHRISLVQWLIGILAFAGLVIAIGPTGGAADWRGLLLAALAAGGATTQFFVGRTLSARMNVLHMGLMVHLALVPVLALMVFALQGGFAVLAGGNAVTAQGISSAGYAALAVVALSYGVAFLCQMSALKLAPASTVAPFFNIEPVTSVMVASIILAEPPSMPELVGGTLVLAALLAAGVAGRRDRRQHSAPDTGHAGG
jgi:drug/metabolite transporter (DMT)-like permease